MDVIERVARAMFIAEQPDGAPFNEFRWGHTAANYRLLASAAVAIVIEDCALVAESESVDGSEWIVARIAGRIRSAPEDSATQADLERLAAT